MYLQIPDYAKVQATIDTLHGSCRLADGSDDPAKGNQLLEVYGITIQLCTATNNNALMKQVRPFACVAHGVRFTFDLAKSTLPIFCREGGLGWACLLFTVPAGRLFQVFTCDVVKNEEEPCSA